MAYTIKKALVGEDKIHYTCQACAGELSSILSEAGKKDKCPLCGRDFVVPGIEELDRRRAEDNARAEMAKHAEQFRARQMEAERIEAIKRQAERKLQRNVVSQEHEASALQEIHHHSGVDRLLRFAFRFGRVVSACVLGVGFLVAIGCAFWLFIIHSEIHSPRPMPPTKTVVPTFADYKSTLRPANGAAGAKPANPVAPGVFERQATPQQEIRSAYGGRISALIKSYKLPESASDVTIGWMVDLPESRRSEFLSGLEALFAEVNRDAPETDFAAAGNWYRRKFVEWIFAVEQAAAEVRAENVRIEVENRLSEEVAWAQRRLALVVIGTCVAAILSFLVLPLLIQIERNTRSLLAKN